MSEFVNSPCLQCDERMHDCLCFVRAISAGFYTNGAAMTESPQATARALAAQCNAHADMCKEWAHRIDVDGTPAQVGPSVEEMRFACVVFREAAAALSTPAPRPPCKKCGGGGVVETVGGEQPCDQCPPADGVAAELRRLADDERRYVSSSGHLDHTGWCKEATDALRQAAARLEVLELSRNAWQDSARIAVARADLIEAASADSRKEGEDVV